MEKPKEQIKELIRRAAEAKDALQAMQFSQAACNAANALCAMSNAPD